MSRHCFTVDQCKKKDVFFLTDFEFGFHKIFNFVLKIASKTY